MSEIIEWGQVYRVNCNCPMLFADKSSKSVKFGENHVFVNGGTSE